MAQLDDATDRLELDAQTGGITEGAVGVGEATEEVGVARPGVGGDDLADPVSTSISSTDSWGSPLRNDEDSMPSPVTAPPRVIVRSCGTTSGISPWARVASTRSLVGAHALDVGGVRVSGST